jgi:glyoxylase-like metal-dependent hydrolase (beta-lactamase superfamily II)
MLAAMKHLTVILVAVLVFTTPALGQGRGQSITTTKVVDGIYMLQGAGGNIGLSVGEDGAFLIDDQFGYMTGPITAAVEKLTEKPIRFVINTHYHGDHTGGNENFGEVGSLIVAHENVRQRLSTEQFSSFFERTTPPSPEKALPVITFDETITFHWNGHELHAFHVENAHTDGDAIIHFRKSNVVHMGDTFFNGLYPYIDPDAGGSMEGMIATADRVLALSNRSTKIIPGHGPLAGRDELKAFRDMLAAVRDNVAKLIKAGKTRDEVVAARPTAEFDEKWGGGFLPPDRWTSLVYTLMTQPAKEAEEETD